MKTFSDAIAGYEAASEKQPHFVFELFWNTTGFASTYFTSSAAAQTPAAADVIDSSILRDGISGQTQKIKPDIATSEIGSITVKLLDVNQAITNKIGTKLTTGIGLRGKVGKVYVGYDAMPFTDYDLRVTYIVDSITYLDGVYTIKLSDIQRASRKKIFSPKETNLKASVSATDMLIPVTTSDLTLFPTFEHGSEYQVRPGETVSYAKIEKEVFCYSGMVNDATLGPSFVVVERGALSTRAVDHTVKTGTKENRRAKIVEYIYIEGAAPKVIYALLTGKVEGQVGDMPTHWHLGIDTTFVKLTDFQTLGNDYWNITDQSGRFAKIENPGTQDGKRYIEKELLLWLGAFMPVYSDGTIGIKRLRHTLADSSYSTYLDASNLKSYGTLTHAMQSVINNIEINWNWVDAKKDFTKTSVLIDAASNTVHGESDVKKFTFKTVHTGLHTDEDLLTYFDTLRDRYSGPPLIMSVQPLPSQSMIEVGDTVRVKLDQVRDFTTSSTLDRVFEVQQVSTNWMTGSLRLSLFGSSQKAGEISRTTLSTVLNDAYYTQAGTELSTVLTIVAGAVTANGTLTGHATDIDNTAAIYYYDGDLTIDAGVTVTVTENVQLRVKGSLQINGDISGIGNGPVGGAQTTLFKNGTITYSYTNSGGRYSWAAFYDKKQGGSAYFGIPTAPLGISPHITGLTTFERGVDRVKTGGISAVPFYRLNNKSTVDMLTGYPQDLRGNAGISGSPVVLIPTQGGAGSLNIVANGGAGGDGGAGLLIVTRGMAFGGNGQINLSGGDSGYGTAFTHSNGNVFYGSAGAPGAPGALFLLIDGNATNPDISTVTLKAKFGDAPAPAGATEVGLKELQEYRTKGWPYPVSISNQPPNGATENNNVAASAHRVIYIPPDETIQQETDPAPADVSNFTALQNGNVVVFRWDSNPDVRLAGFELRYGARGATSFADATPLTQVTKGTSITSADVPPGDWTLYNAAVNDSTPLNYSETPATVDLVVTAALDVIFQTAQAPDWFGTLTNFVKHHTNVLVPKSQNLASADGWETFDQFVVNPYPTCTYEAPEIDITFDDAVRVWGAIDSALGPGETTGVANPGLSIDYRLAAGAYDGFENWSVGEVTLRYCKQKLTLDTSKGVSKIIDFLPTVDVLERTASGDNITVSSGGSAITFSQPFHNAPFVRVFVDSATALIPTKENVTTTGFDFNIFNVSGTNVGGIGSWEATGS